MANARLTQLKAQTIPGGRHFHSLAQPLYPVRLIMNFTPTRRIVVVREAQKPAKKAWKSPSLRTIKLTEDEIAELRASDDPMTLLPKIRPDINTYE